MNNQSICAKIIQTRWRKHNCCCGGIRNCIVHPKKSIFKVVFFDTTVKETEYPQDNDILKIIPDWNVKNKMYYELGPTHPACVPKKDNDISVSFVLQKYRGGENFKFL